MKYDLSLDLVRYLYQEHCYPIDDKGINPFAIRNDMWSGPDNFVIDKFNDIIGIMWGDNILAYSGTTKPGRSPLERDNIHENGVFILAHGFYEGCFRKGFHRGKYKALVQFGNKFWGWRDNNKDGKFDLDRPNYNDVTGLNLHTTRWDKQVKNVGDFSEGCQVIEVAKEYDKMMVDVIWASDQSLFNYALFRDVCGILG